MEQLRQKLESVFSKQFPSSETQFEYVKMADKIGGIIAWAGFDGLEPIDRQTEVWNVLRAHLKRDDQVKISAIITLSPAEYAVYKREQSVDREPLAA